MDEEQYNPLYEALTRASRIGRPSDAYDTGVKTVDYGSAYKGGLWSDGTQDLAQGQYGIEGLDINVADEQGTVNAIFSGVVNNALSIVPKFIGQFAALEDIPLLSPSIFGKEEPGNFVTRAMDSAEESLNEAIPIYPSTKYQSDDMSSKMWTAKFWADDVTDGIAFMAAALLGSKGVGLATKAGLAAAGIEGASLVGRGLPFLTGVTYSAASESLIEGRETFKNIKARLATEINPATGLYYTAEESDKLAADAATNVAQANMAMLMITNGIEHAAIFGDPTKVASKYKADVLNGKITKSPRYFNFGTAAGIAQEGAEELMQTSLQQAATERAVAGEEDSFFSTVGNAGVNFLKGTGDIAKFLISALPGVNMYEGKADQDERVESALLGLLVATPTTLVKRRSEWKADKRLFDEAASERNLIVDELKKAHAIGLTTLNEYYDENGIRYDNIAKAAALLFDQEELLSRQQEAIANNDVHAIEYFNTLIQSNIYNQYMNSKIFQTPEQAHEAYMNSKNNFQFTEEDKKKFKDPAGVEDSYNRFKQNIDQLFKARQAASDSLSSEETKKYGKTFVQSIISQMTQYQAVIDRLTGVKDKLTDESQKEDVENTINYYKEQLDRLSTKTGRSEVFEEFKKSSVSMKSLYEVAKRMNPNMSEDEQAVWRYTLEEEKFIEGDITKPFITNLGVDGKSVGYRNRAAYEFYKNRKSKNRADTLFEGVKNGTVSINSFFNFLKSAEGKFLTSTEVDDYLNELDTLRNDPANNPKDASREMLSGSLSEEGVKVLNGLESAEMSDNDSFLKAAEDYIKNNNLNPTRFDLDRIAEHFGYDPIDVFMDYEEGGLVGFYQNLSKEPGTLNQDLKTKYDNITELSNYDGTHNINLDNYYQPKEYDENEGAKAFLQEKYYNEFNNLVVDKMQDENFMDLNRVKRALDNIYYLQKVFGPNSKMSNESIYEDLLHFQEKLKKLQEEIENRLNNRFANQMNSLEKYHQLMKDAFGINENPEVNSEIYNQITSIPGVSELLSGEVDFTLGHYEKILNLIRGNKEVIKAIKAANKQNQNLVNDKFKKLQFGSSLYSRGIVGKTNTNSLIRNIMLSLKEYGTLGKLEAFLQYFYIHKELDTLIQDLNNVTEDELSANNLSREAINDFIELLQLAERVDASTKLINELEEPYNFGETIVKYRSLINKFNTSFPTLQQFIAAMEIIKAMSRSYTNNDFDWTYMKGIAGSGKSQFVAKVIVHILGLDKVFVMSKTKHATENIAKSGATTSFVYDDFINLTEDKFNSLPEFLIFDEIGVLKHSELLALNNKLLAINEYRVANNKPNIKTLVIGDPTQVTQDTITGHVRYGLPIEEGQLLGPKGIIYMNSLVEVPSLTESYRTDISSITDAASAFRGKLDSVQSALFVSDKEPGNSDIKGVQSLNTTDFDTQIKTPVSGNRTRLIIVDSEEKRQAYISKGYNAVTADTVLTYSDAQGLTFDEVFIDVDPNSTDSALNYNKIMYTSIGRAKFYAAVLDHKGIFKNFIDDAKVSEAENNAVSDVSKNKEILNDYLDKVIDAYDSNLVSSVETVEPELEVSADNTPINVEGTLKESDVTSKDDSFDKDDTVNENDVITNDDSSDESDPVETPPIFRETQPGDISIPYAESAVIKTLTDTNTGKLKDEFKGLPVIFAKTFVKTKGEGLQGISVYVIVNGEPIKIAEIGNSNNPEFLALLNDPKVGDELAKKLKELNDPAIKPVNEKDFIKYIKNKDPKSKVAKHVIDTNDIEQSVTLADASQLFVNYNMELTEFPSGNMFKEIKDAIFNSLGLNESDFKGFTYMRLKIYTNKDLVERPELVGKVIPGIPYFEVMIDKANQFNKPIRIKLWTKRYTQDHQDMKNIETFTKAYDRFWDQASDSLKVKLQGFGSKEFDSLIGTIRSFKYVDINRKLANKLPSNGTTYEEALINKFQKFHNLTIEESKQLFDLLQQTYESFNNETDTFEDLLIKSSYGIDDKVNTKKTLFDAFKSIPAAHAENMFNQLMTMNINDPGKTGRTLTLLEWLGELTFMDGANHVKIGKQAISFEDILLEDDSVDIKKRMAVKIIKEIINNSHITKRGQFLRKLGFIDNWTDEEGTWNEAGIRAKVPGEEGLRLAKEGRVNRKILRLIRNNVHRQHKAKENPLTFISTTEDGVVIYQVGKLKSGSSVESASPIYEASLVNNTGFVQKALNRIAIGNRPAKEGADNQLSQRLNIKSGRTLHRRSFKIRGNAVVYAKSIFAGADKNYGEFRNKLNDQLIYLYKISTGEVKDAAISKDDAIERLRQINAMTINIEGKQESIIIQPKTTKSGKIELTEDSNKLVPQLDLSRNEDIVKNVIKIAFKEVLSKPNMSEEDIEELDPEEWINSEVEDWSNERLTIEDLKDIHSSANNLFVPLSKSHIESLNIQDESVQESETKNYNTRFAVNSDTPISPSSVVLNFKGGKIEEVASTDIEETTVETSEPIKSDKKMEDEPFDDDPFSLDDDDLGAGDTAINDSPKC